MEIKLEDQLNSKKEEIKNHIASRFNHVEQIDDIAEIIMNNFCELKAPLKIIDYDTNVTYTKIDHRLGLRGGTSIKNGNIFLSWKRLLFDSAEHTLTLVGAVTTSILAPVIIPFAALVVWNKLWSLREIKIEERHAMILSVLWQNRNEDSNIVSNIGIIEIINSALAKYDRPKIEIEEYSLIVSDLAELKVLELKSDGTIWLRDWVKIPY